MHRVEWKLRDIKADFDDIGSRFLIDPITARVMISRGISCEDMPSYLMGDIKDMHDPSLLPDIDKAGKSIIEAINNNKKIRIVGDYDIDGICATYILVKTLENLGADVDYRIPDRIKDGYGINIRIIDEAREDGIDLILTCDNGIAAIDEIKKAIDHGIHVVVTDHHQVRKDDSGIDILPDADAVVDPARSDSIYPYKGICGAMVAYKVMQYIYAKYKHDKKYIEKFIPYAAIATVGDVMKLVDENRIVVKHGLKMIAKCDNIGLMKLIDECKVNPSSISAYTIGFVIGPCLNAGGRLESAKVALDMFLTSDEDKAAKAAHHLKNLNDERKDMTIEYTKLACSQVEDIYHDDKVIVVYLPNCHESIAGIIAGRLREEYHKPSIVMTDASDGGIKGSGRSIESYDMFAKLCEVSDLMIKFGGHPMAAGVSMDRDNLDEFRKRLNDNCNLCDDDFIEIKYADCELPFKKVSDNLIKDLSKLEPYGNGNEKPIFLLKNIEILSIRILGQKHNCIKLSLRDEEKTVIDGLIFTDGDAWIDKLGDCRNIDILYYPDCNEYGGNKSMQAMIKDMRFH